MPRVHLSDEVAVNFLRLGPPSSDRPALVLLHGLASSAAFWLPAAQQLSQKHPVLLYDLRGHGRSSMPTSGYTPAAMAEDLAGLLDHLEVERAILVAHSFAGSVAVSYANLHPERVAGLLLADARIRLLQPAQSPRCWTHWEVLKSRLEAMDIVIDENHPEGGTAILTELARAQLDSRKSAAGPKWVSSFFGHGGSRYSARRWLDLLDRTTAGRDLETDEQLTRADLAAIRTPALAVYGEHSPVLPTAHALTELWPHLGLHLIAGAGHFFPLTQSQDFLAAISPFLEDESGCGSTLDPADE